MSKFARDRVFLIAALAPAIYFAIRLLDQSKLTKIFPIDAFANDWSSHIGRLFLLAKYGYHAHVSDWYGGNFVLFKLYPPLGYYFGLPWYYILGNPQAAIFATALSAYALALIAIILIGKTMKFSAVKTTAFFVFFFANPITIGYILRLGKVIELAAWAEFLFLFWLILYYGEKQLDAKFYFGFTMLLSLLLYIHLLVFIVASILALGFLLSRNKNEILGLLTVSAAVVTITSPVWLNFILRLQSFNISSYTPLSWIVSPLKTALFDRVTSIVVPAAFLGLLLVYVLQKNPSWRKGLVLFIPALFAVFYMTRLLVHVPLFNRPTPDTYNIFFIILAIFILLELDIKKFYSGLKYLSYIVIILLPLAGVALSHMHTPYFQPHTQSVKDTFALVPSINGYFILTGQPREVYAPAVYSYATIYYNKKSLDGWSPDDISAEYLSSLHTLFDYFSNNDFLNYKKQLISLNGREVITYGRFCDDMLGSGFKTVKKSGDACLLAADTF